jgi:transcriptional regulator
MYLPDQFREERVEVLHAFIELHPLGTLVASVDGRPEANHVPMLLDRAGGALGTLAGHVARANPVWRNVADATEVLVVFGGADAYVSPSSYPSKKTDGRVVPTWNYAVAHVYGRIRYFDDHGRLHALVSALTGRHEAGQTEPWAVTDAPAAYIDAMLKAIVGFEIEIAEISGKFKASQNRLDADRAGVRSRLRESRGEADLDELVGEPAPHRKNR